MNIQVTIKNIYGMDRIYPHCDKAKLFAAIADTSTLTISTVAKIKNLGYTVEVVHNGVKTL